MGIEVIDNIMVIHGGGTQGYVILYKIRKEV